MVDYRDILQKIDKKENLNKDNIVGLLEIDKPEVIEELKMKARSLVEEELGSKGKVWGAIGLDYKPCPMDCSFCSFAKKWNNIDEEAELTDEEVLSIARTYVDKGVDWLVIRTTEFYDFDRLISKVKLIKENVKGDYVLAVNTGDDNSKRVDELKAAGVEMVYHAIRLREGIDTRFSRSTRIETAKSIVDSKMILSQYLEPLGPEHTNDEIADSILDIMSSNAGVLGIMTRVSVKGTPKFECGNISDDRIGHIMAVFRLANFGRGLDIIIHPYSDSGLRSGANALVVDIGAIPRSDKMNIIEWDNMDIDKARGILSSYNLN